MYVFVFEMVISISKKHRHVENKKLVKFVLLNIVILLVNSCNFQVKTVVSMKQNSRAHSRTHSPYHDLFLLVRHPSGTSVLYDLNR